MSRWKNKRLCAAFVFNILAGYSPLAASEAPVIEPGFPFQGLTIDARDADDALPKNNLVPRGLVLPLGHNAYACYDTDLLRLAVVWQAPDDGPPIDYRSIATLSYHDTKKKAPGGQDKLSRPLGRMICGTGIYAGLQVGETVFEDPRPPGPDPGEVGRGPYGRWVGIYDLGRNRDRTVIHPGPPHHAPVLWYQVDSGSLIDKLAEAVFERIDAIPFGKEVAIRRSFNKEGWGESGKLVIAEFEKIVSVTKRNQLTVVELADKSVFAIQANALRVVENRYLVCTPDRFEPFHVIFWRGSKAKLASFERIASQSNPMAISDFEKVGRQWPESSTTAINRSTEEAPYVFDIIELPKGRVVRPSCIDFFEDGRMALVTIDGDVWIVSGLDAGATTARWQKVAAGLHEPQTICVRDGLIFVGSRNGIEGLSDTDGDGEIDVYHMLSNRFAQAADTRDMLHSMVAMPDGRFLFTKGGQQIKYINNFSGRVLEVSPDGEKVSVFATGLRNAYLAAHPGTGLLTATDQQGHWVPTTPVHIIERGKYYGFHRGAPGGDKAPEPEVQPPLSWIPHRLAQCGAGQVWASDDFGPLSGRLLMLDYYGPGVLDVDHETGAVAPLLGRPPLPVLKGAVHPKEGAVYMCGFQIWGTASKSLRGLVRMRYTGLPTLHLERVAHGDVGIILRFNTPLDREKALQPGAWDVQRWNYKRTPKYGSGHYRLDGKPGQEYLAVRSVHRSVDGKAAFLDIPGMAKAMQMKVTWSLGVEAPLSDTVCFSIHEDPTELDLSGFPQIDFSKLAALATSARSDSGAMPATADRGAQLYTTYGCLACHSVDGTTKGKTGPTWKNLHNAKRVLLDGTEAFADDAYLREAILDPAARIVKGYDPKDVGMPSYRGILSDTDVEALMLYIRSLSDSSPASE